MPKPFLNCLKVLLLIGLCFEMLQVGLLMTPNNVKAQSNSESTYLPRPSTKPFMLPVTMGHEYTIEPGYDFAQYVDRWYVCGSDGKKVFDSAGNYTGRSIHQHHLGIDIISVTDKDNPCRQNSAGKKIYSVANGKIEFIQRSSTDSGGRIIMSHTYRQADQDYTVYAYYYHLKNIPVSIEQGDHTTNHKFDNIRLADGRLNLGEIENLGQYSYNSHLHLEFKDHLDTNPGTWNGYSQFGNYVDGFAYKLQYQPYNPIPRDKGSYFSLNPCVFIECSQFATEDNSASNVVKRQAFTMEHDDDVRLAADGWAGIKKVTISSRDNFNLAPKQITFDTARTCSTNTIELAKGNYYINVEVSNSQIMPVLSVIRSRETFFDLTCITSDAEHIANNPGAYKALHFLQQQTDKYHTKFDVYTDAGSGGNHFVHRARMGEGAALDDFYRYDKYSGTTAIKNTFTATGDNWGGWYFQNGVLLPDGIQPIDNWGDYPNAGYNLNGSTKLSFWAKGHNGGEVVEFFAFGTGWDGNSPIKPYPDSSPKVSLCNVWGCSVTLSNQWTKYEIDVSWADKGYVTGGFGWVTNSDMNSDGDITFYIDEISYDKPRLNEPRFPISYETIDSGNYNNHFDYVLENVSFSYDNALVLMSFIAMHDWDRSKILADSFVFAHDNDRFYTDGRIRNTYKSGDLSLYPGWHPSGGQTAPFAALPNWSHLPEDIVYEDKEFVGTYVGNVAWPSIALLNYYESQGGQVYLDTALSMAQWIHDNTLDNRGVPGYKGGFEGWEYQNNPPYLWKSTEHNIDVYVVFRRLYQITGDQIWFERSMIAKGFVDAMFNTDSGFYWTGTEPDGVTINEIAIPLDTQTWSTLAFGNSRRASRAMKFVEENFKSSFGQFDGFDFNTDRDQPWPEGTGQMAVAYKVVGANNKSSQTAQELNWIQDNANNGDGYGLVSAPGDGLTTGFHWTYENRLHTGATAWHVMGSMGYNPFWPSGVIPDVIDVDESENNQPVVYSLGEQIVGVGGNIGGINLNDYGYDPEGGALTWTLLDSYPGFNITIDNAYLQISAQNNAPIGDEIFVQATDQQGNSAITSIGVVVTEQNMPFTASLDNNVAYTGHEFVANLQIVSEDDDIHTVSLVSGVSGMAYADGKLRWTPTDSQTGNHAVRFLITDSAEVKFFDFEVVVDNVANSPRLESIPSQARLVGQTFDAIGLNSYLSFAEGGQTVSWSVLHNEQLNVQIDNGQLQFIPPANWIGQAIVSVFATDQNGLSDYENIVFQVMPIPVTPTPTLVPTIPPSTSGQVKLYFRKSDMALVNMPGTQAETVPVVGANGGNYDGNPNNAKVFIAEGINARYLSEGSETFDLFLDSTGPANAVQLKLEYDTNGDNQWDWYRIYNYFATNDLAGFEKYSATQGIKSTTGSLQDMVNGKVRVTIWSAIGNGNSAVATDNMQVAGQVSNIKLPFEYGAFPTPTSLPLPTSSPTPTSTVIPAPPSSGNNSKRYLLADTLSQTPGNSRIMGTIVSAGGHNYDGIVNNAVTFTADNLTGAYNQNSAEFVIFLDALAAANGQQLKLSYDFDGNSTYDRSEIYNYYATDDVPGWQSYTSNSGIKSVTGSWQNMQNGKIKLEIWNAIGNVDSKISLNAAEIEGAVSYISVPFDIQSHIPFSNNLFLAGDSSLKGNAQPAQEFTVTSSAGGTYNGVPHNPQVFTMSSVSAIYDPSVLAKHEIFVDSGNFVGNAVQVRISYDFTGDGNIDKYVTYKYFATNNVAGYEKYTESKGIKNEYGSWENLQNGTIKVEIWSAIGSAESKIKIGDVQNSKVIVPFR